MKKRKEEIYRVGYDQVFVADPEVIIENEIITSLSIMIKYKLFNIKLKDLEILFTGKETGIGKKSVWVESEPILHTKLTEAYITDFIICSFNKKIKNYIKVDILEEKLRKQGYRLEYEIDKYYKEIKESDTSSISVEISKEEFFKILKENSKKFNNSDNVPTQTTSCSKYPVLEEVINDL